ncbi:MAG: septum formation protein Maf [Acidobacteria bacterium]|nr:septum formation protein Maf [Acidobacteriota bacterium]
MRGSRTKPKWILASASPRRSEILSGLGLLFVIDPCGLIEPPRRPRETPSNYAVRLARFKAREVSGRHRSGRILSADTIVVLGDDILGKPEIPTEARHMIRRLSGRWHEVITGICLLDCARNRARTTFGRTRVRFRRLSSAEIDWYLKSGEYRDKAGAYGIQGYASLFIDRIEGCYFNIVGFPISAFEKLCRRSGIDLIQDLKF